MVPGRKHLTTPTLYYQQAQTEYDTIDVYYLSVFGYRAPFGPPWYDLFSGWYVIHTTSEYVTLSRYPILPPRKGWGSRVFWLSSLLPIDVHSCLCRYRADLMDVTYIPYQQIIGWFIDELTIRFKLKNYVMVYITSILLGMMLLCVEVSWHKFNVRIKNRLLELLEIVTHPATFTNVRSTMN